MSLTTQTEGDVLIVTVGEDRIDAASAVQFKDDFFNLTREGTGRVILDLGNVEFLDSSGLGAVVASMKSLEDGKKLDISGLTPNVEKVFRLTRMDSIFRIFDNLDAAIQEKMS